MSAFGYQPTYQPSYAKSEPGSANNPPSANPMFMAAKPRGDGMPSDYYPGMPINLGQAPGGPASIGGLPPMNAPMAGGALAANFGQESKEAWKTPDAVLTGYHQRQVKWPWDRPHTSFTYAPGKFDLPFASLNEAASAWGGAMKDPVFSAQGLLNRVQNMNAQQLNTMDFEGVRKSFEGVSQRLADAYANDEYARRAGSSLQEQRSWLENAYNLLVQKGNQENVF